eukprot:4241747-Pleurochrysis_carterae.AAC.1
MPAKSAPATLCCAGAEPAACRIAELEYGNPLDLIVIFNINICMRVGYLRAVVPLSFGAAESMI